MIGCLAGRKLTLRILMRTIHVVAPHNDAWQLEAFRVGVDVHLSSCLAGCIWVGRTEDAVFEQVRISMFGLAIDFISRDVDEPLDSDLDCRLEHNVCAADVGFCERERVAKAEIDVGLSSKMEDGINTVLSQAAKNGFFVCHVAENELEVGARVETFGVLESCAVVDLVEGEDVVIIWVGQSQVADHPGSSAECQ